MVLHVDRSAAEIPPASDWASGLTIPPWAGLILLLAALKTLGALGGALLGQPAPIEPFVPAPPLATTVVNVLVFASAAALLILGGRRDRRAVYLGGFFLLITTAFGDRLLRQLAPVFPSWAPAVEILDGLEVDAFLPAFLWLFVRDFPEPHSLFALRGVVRVGVGVSVAAGVGLFLVNLVLNLQSLLEIPAGTLDVLSNFARSGGERRWYYPLLFILEVAALPVAIWNARSARATERRRFGVFLAGLAIGIAPIALEVTLETLSPAYYRFVMRPSLRGLYYSTFYAALLFLPVGTTYAVLVQHVLDVRLILRKVLQYALARYTVIAAAALPFAGIGWYLSQHREESLSQLFSGPRLLLLLASGLAGLAALNFRRAVLLAIDRHFFREHYDSRRALSALFESTRQASTEAELATLLRREIDRALHLDSIAVLVHDPSTGRLVAPDGAARSLDGSSALATVIAVSAEPLDVDLARPRSLVGRLPDDQRQWLADGAFHLLVPMLGSDGSLVGVIALGEKKSELPFQSEDRLLLSTVAASGALALENRLLRAAGADRPVPGASREAHPTAPSLQGEEIATECPRCRLVTPPRVTVCAQCAGELRPAAVPYILAGKFRFEQKVGGGGMGVVYRAVDLALARTVAIKTLPRISPEDTTRLRREARAAATILHPNLALIFGVETWRGTPMLIFEFLDGGTLADRVARGLLSPDEVIQLGANLAEVLDRTHGAGLMHCDIKPSNIGYQADGTPKLLDFGVSHLLHESRRRPGASVRRDEPASALTTRTGEFLEIDGAAAERPVSGTLAYLSPEVARGEPLDPSFDLWSLAIVLFEALTGKNPLLGKTALDTLLLVRQAQVPDARRLRPDCPPGLALFLGTALAQDRSRRPSSAREFRTALQQARHVAAA